MGGVGRRRILAAAAACAAAPFLGPGRGRAAELGHDANLASVGNSLTDETVDIVHFFARARGGRGALGAQSIPGASMRWNWDHAAEASVNGRALLARGGQDLWLGVESVPFRHVQGPGEPCDLAAWRDWTRLAAEGGVARLYLFEAWHDLRSGRPDYAPEDRADPDVGVPWRARIDLARPHWEAIADHADAGRRRGDPELAIVPGGRMLAAVHDDIGRGAAPGGLAAIGDLFADSIHPNPLGRYALACLVYACLYRRSPEGLPAAAADRHGRPFPRVPAALAGYFQRRAWSVARADARSGVSA